MAAKFNQRAVRTQPVSKPKFTRGDTFFADEKLIPKDKIDSPFPLPGETQDDFQFRLSARGLHNEVRNPGATEDTFTIDKFAKEQQRTGREFLGEQTGVAQNRLQELTELLAKEENRKFNESIPEIAESNQARGFLETSGFGGALARERTKLAGETAFRVGEQGIRDRDLEISGIGKLGRRELGIRQAGLSRTFSTADLTRSEQLARQLGRMGVSAPAQPSGGVNAFQGALGGATVGGSVGGPVGAVVGAGVGLVAANNSDDSYLCTHLKNIGLITEKEVKEIHDKMYSTVMEHPVEWFYYGIKAPLFLKSNPNVDWKQLKSLLYDDIINSTSNEEAFQKYKSTCIDLFAGKFSLVEAT